MIEEEDDEKKKSENQTNENIRIHISNSSKKYTYEKI